MVAYILTITSKMRPPVASLKKYATICNLGAFPSTLLPANKTANVNARIQQNIKTDAEAILSRMGIPRSVAIDMFYRQIFLHNGIPFPLTIPRDVPARDQMTDAQFNQMMKTGLDQARSDDAYDVDEVFDDLMEG